MEIDKELLPLKMHFFLSSAGRASVTPFLPVLAKQLGLTSVTFGWIRTVCPVMLVLLKPWAGTIIDKFKYQKLIFLTLLIIAGFLRFCIHWINPLPTSNTAQIVCSDRLSVIIYSGLLNTGVLKDSLNSPVICQAIIGTSILSKLFSNITYYNDEFLSEDMDLNIEFGEVSKLENGCLVIWSKKHYISTSVMHSLMCQAKRDISLELICNNTFIQTLVNKSSIQHTSVLLTHQFWSLLFLIMLCSLGSSIANSMSDVFCFGILKDRPEKYGAQRIWSAIGWGLPTIITGLVVDRLSDEKIEKDYSPAFYIMLILISLDVLIATRIKVVITEKSPSVKRDIKKLFKNSKVVIFAFWCFLTGFFHSFIYNFLLWYVEDLAVTDDFSLSWVKTLQGVIIAIQGYLGEIPITFFSGQILKKFGHTNCMTFVLMAFGLRFILYSTVTNPWLILPIEPLNGITFGLMYATMTTHASEISPSGAKTTVQHIFSSLYEGAGIAAGSLIGGYLIDGLGGAKTFFLLGSIGIIAAILHMGLHKYLETLEKAHQGEGRRKEQEPLATTSC